MTDNLKSDTATSLTSSTSSASSGSSPSSDELSIEKAVEDLTRSPANNTNTNRSTITSRAVSNVTSSSVATKSPQEAAQTSTASSSSTEDNFENLQKAVSILAKAKQLDEVKRYDEALKMYRQGVDMLLEELIIRQGTDQSRTYLRDKCNDFMNRIDQVMPNLVN